MNDWTPMHTYADAEGTRAMQEFELETAQAAWGEMHPTTLLAKNNLGCTLHQLGCLPEARALLRSALQDCLQVWGKRHCNSMTAMHNLAIALYDEDNAQEALQLLRTALKWRRRNLGQEHPETLSTMQCLARVFNTLGDHPAAQKLQSKLLEVRQQELDEDHPATLEAMGQLGITTNNMAVDLRNAGHLQEAEPLQWEALAMIEKAFGTDHLASACVYSATGALSKKIGQLERARTYFEKALAIREQQLGANDRLTQLVRMRLQEMLH